MNIATRSSRAPLLCARCRCELAGGLVADATQALWLGKDIGLTASECRVLKLLLDHAGTYLTYRQLYDVMHRPGFYSSGGLPAYGTNVRTAVKRMRRKLSEAGVDGTILNRPTIGYTWMGVPHSTPIGVER